MKQLHHILLRKCGRFSPRRTDSNNSQNKYLQTQNTLFLLAVTVQATKGMFPRQAPTATKRLTPHAGEFETATLEETFGPVAGASFPV